MLYEKQENKRKKGKGEEGEQRGMRESDREKTNERVRGKRVGPGRT